MSAAHELEAIEDITALAGGFPAPEQCLPFSEDEAEDLAKHLLPSFVKILNGDETTLSELYYDDGFWRDQVALSWTFRTFHQKDKIVSNVPSLLRRAQIEDIALSPGEVQVINLPNNIPLLRVGINFRTANPAAKCHAAFKLLRLSTGEVKIFTTSTAIRELDVAPWGDYRRSKPVAAELPSRTDALIVGAGHAGLALASYMQAMNLDFAILDREQQVGDAWAKRYDSATLHTSRVFSGLPYKPFPRDYPEFVPAYLIAEYYKSYVKDLNLPLYQSTNVNKATWDDEKQEWTVQTSRGTIVTRSLIFAIGIGGRFAIKPDYPGEDQFKGEILHSEKYVNPDNWKGKKVVVIGASTTGLDVGWDCSKEGIDVTVVQRGPVRMYGPSHTYNVQNMIWNDTNGADAGDIMATEDPVVLNATLSSLMLGAQKAAHDPAYYTGLAKAGFLATTDGAVQNQIFCRAGKHYPDIGAGQAIIDGEIKIKSGTLISHVTPTGVAFQDGSHLDADVICYCTGFEKDNRGHIYSIIGNDIKLEPVWNLDKEGEIRGVFRPSGHPGVFIQGGELQTMRYYGRFLALQVAAVLAGVRPEPVRA